LHRISVRRFPFSFGAYLCASSSRANEPYATSASAETCAAGKKEARDSGAKNIGGILEAELG
jgi:hypothetical protein